MVVRIATKLSSVLLFIILSFAGKAQLTANFKGTPIKGCAPLVVHFTDVSTNNPTKWRWDLGNGTISFLKNPSATYFTPGSYTIKLTVSNSTDTATIVKTEYVNVFAQPDVQFTSSLTSGCFPLPIQFTDQSIANNGNINLWQWDFGDGLSSALQNPLHIYKTIGNYTVTLRVRNSNGCLNILSKTKYIQINSGASADFSNDYPDNCSLPVAINFNNLSTGSGVLSYKWFFGDGTTSNQTTPSHLYTSLGTYSIKLIVTNSSGCTDTIIKQAAINIVKIKASFTNPDTVCTQKLFVFTNNSVPIPLSNKWDFGDSTFSTLINPEKIYTTPGNYQVKLIANFGNCADTSFKNIIVAAKTTSQFISDGEISCVPPFKVNFTNQSLNSFTYQWNFGDSTTSVLKNPTHTYTRNGIFTVQLVSTNSNGCTDTLIKTNFINIQKPSITITSLPDSGCVPLFKQLSSSAISANPIKNYLWNFGDGNTSTQSNPTHIYDSNGVYTLTLIVTNTDGCKDTAILKRGVIASKKPVVNFDASPRKTCASIPVVFTDLTTGGATKWLWKFGDGITSPLQNPTHLYPDTGTFKVQLIVWNNGCTDSITYKDFINIHPPIGEFNYLIDCKNPFKRTFTDLSIAADQWNWNFGDGSTSTLKNPIHEYLNTGVYQVTQTSINTSTGCDYVKIKNLVILNTKAAFTLSDSVICKGGSINFTTNISTSEVYSFNWNFGDGTFINMAGNSVKHTYKQSGYYNVTLITTNNLGCKDTLTKTTQIRVNGPTAKFSSSVVGSCLNSAVSFNDQSVTDGINLMQSYYWDYGDGNTQTFTAAPFEHTYVSPGSYQIKLLLTDQKGCMDSFSLPSPLIISKPKADFNSINTLTCPSGVITLTNASTGPDLTYFWKFGDGNTSVLQNPSHSYLSDGIFAITLIITDKYGCIDSITKSNFITIVSPVANFVMSDSLSACPPLIVQFTNLSTNIISKSWDFGDGILNQEDHPSHFYSYPGTYTAQLSVIGPGGCVSVLQKSINIKGPTGTFNYDPLIGCTPKNVNFTASTSEINSIIWDFNDGTIIDNSSHSISHIYTYPGAYRPKIILTDKEGCAIPIRATDTITVYGVTANFDFIHSTYCDSATVLFTDLSTSNDLIISYDWELAEGINSSNKNPQHQYTSTGFYNPSLKVTTQFGCVDSAKAIFPVKIVASPKISMTTTANGCTPLTMLLNGSPTVADTSAIKWQWNFGNGNVSSLQNPEVQNYLIKGLYTIGLLATNSSGCTDSISKTIEAYGLPILVATQDTFICEKRGISLNVEGASAYKWSPSKDLSCINCSTPFANPEASINYAVEGTSNHGCKAVDTIKILVKHPFKIKYSTRDTLCKSQSANLFVTGASTYIWSPGTGLNNPTSSTPVAKPDITTNYIVIGTDEKGCFKDTGSVFIKVYPIPVVNAGADVTFNVGQSYNILPKISNDVTEVSWSPTSGIFNYSYPGISIKPIENTEYTVSVKNEGGCTAQDKINIVVVCNGANIFIPNTFSPNGDGANDIFYPRGTGIFKIQSIRVFNRWGQTMFEKNNFNVNDINAGWNGTFKGMKLEPDVFIYIMDIICDNNSLLSYKGNITLIL